MSKREFRTISQNVKRNMQMVVTPEGQTLHIRIDERKPGKPKSNRPGEVADRIKVENNKKRKK